MAERSLHQTAAAQRDLSIFQTLSKNSSAGTYPYQHLFDYLDNRSALSSKQRAQLDVSELTQEIQKHPGQPQNLYLLTEAYLKLGQLEAARDTDRATRPNQRDRLPHADRHRRTVRALSPLRRRDPSTFNQRCRQIPTPTT